MGTISDKLTYLNTTKGKIKDAINLTGANILSEDTFRSYADKLKQGLVDAINDGGSTIYSNFPKTTGTGTEIALNDTYGAPMEIGLKGNTHQDSYTGYNFLKNEQTTTTKNGITFTMNEDGSINITGTATANAELFILGSWGARNNDYLEHTTYTFYSVNDLPSGLSVNLAFFNNESNNYNKGISSNIREQTFNISNLTYDGISCAILVTNGTTINYKLKLMLVKGDTELSYEPYTGSTETTLVPSPNPDYPQPIEVVTGNNTINVCGKNLFDKTITKSQGDGRIGDTTLETGKKLTWNGASATTGYMWLGYVIKDISNYVGKTVRFKTNFSASASNTPQYAIGICDSDGNNRTSKASSSTSGNTISFAIPSLSGTQTYLYVLLYANSGGTLNPNDYVDFTNMILTIDNEDMTYEAYQGSNYSINLGSIELCKIGTYQDYIYKDNGKWYKHSEIGKVVLDGSENWSRGNPTHRYFTTINGQTNLNSIPFSNYFIGYASSIPSNVNGVLLQHADTSTIRINLYNLNIL